MDQTSLSIGLGVFGALFSGGFLLMAITDHRRAQIEARLLELPNRPLKSGNAPTQAATAGGEHRRPAKPLGTKESDRQQPSSPSKEAGQFVAKVGSPRTLACMIVPVLVVHFLRTWGLSSGELVWWQAA